MGIDAAKPPRTAFPWVAVLLSLLTPGGGLWYAGRPKTALAVGAASLALPFAVLGTCLWLGVSARVLAITTALGLVAFYLAQLTFAAIAALRASSRASWYGTAAFALGLLVVAIVTPDGTRLVEPFRMSANSMAPTLVAGDQLMIDRMRGASDLSRGDIVAFVGPSDAIGDDVWLKRVVALGGDVVVTRGHRVWVNGKLLESGACEQTYPRPFSSDLVEPECLLETSADGVTYPVLHDRAAPAYEPIERLEVPADHVFLLGDNRDRSSDSRRWGPLPQSHVVGRSLGRYWDGDGKDRYVGVR